MCAFDAGGGSHAGGGGGAVGSVFERGGVRGVECGEGVRGGCWVLNGRLVL